METISLNNALEHKTFRRILADDNLNKLKNYLEFRKGVVAGKTRYTVTVKSKPVR